jgi:hypothetical protein
VVRPTRFELVTFAPEANSYIYDLGRQNRC